MNEMESVDNNHNDLNVVRGVKPRSSVTEWRADGVLSAGGSRELLLLRRRRSSSLDGGGDGTTSCATGTTRPRRRASSCDLMHNPTYISIFMEDMKWALQELNENVELDPKSLEKWAIFVHDCLTQESRGYHDVAHVFEVSAGSSPIQLLAAFFRDVLNHCIDGGAYPPTTNEENKDMDGEDDSSSSTETTTARLLKGYVVPGTYRISPDIFEPRDLLAARIFGHAPGDDLQDFSGQFKGLDIFLSAVVTIRLLKDVLSLKHTAQLLTCMEGTIPFRKAATPNGPTPFDILYERLVRCNQDFDLGMDDAEIVETIQLAADTSNRQVGNMVTTDLSLFLEHTWKLLPEQNAALRKHALYTIHDYHDAIASMTKLLENMEPAHVYVSFRDMPPPSETASLRAQLSRNLRFAVTYLKARLLSVSTVAALACLTPGGANVPKSFFFGDVPSVNDVNVKSDRLGDHIALQPQPMPPQSKTSPSGDICASSLSSTSTPLVAHRRTSTPWAIAKHTRRDRKDGNDGAGDETVEDDGGGLYNIDVYNVLRGVDGMSNFNFDVRDAPVAAYMYQELGDAQVLQALEQCCGGCHSSSSSVSMTKESSRALLQWLPPHVVVTIANEVARITVSRSKALDRLLVKLGIQEQSGDSNVVPST